MKNNRSFIFFLLLCLYFYSCGNKENRNSSTEKKEKATSSPGVSQPLNPNGESELALLMRDMVSTTQKIQDGLKNNTVLPSYPEAFGRIYFAKKTDSTLNKELFNSLADSYLASLKYFYDAPQKQKVHTYNGMVNSCISCHENFCGGPIKRIKKFLLPEEK